MSEHADEHKERLDELPKDERAADRSAELDDLIQKAMELDRKMDQFYGALIDPANDRKIDDFNAIGGKIEGFLNELFSVLQRHEVDYASELCDLDQSVTALIKKMDQFIDSPTDPSIDKGKGLQDGSIEGGEPENSKEK